MEVSIDIKQKSQNKIALAAVCLSAIMLGLEITSIPSILPTLEKILPANFKQLQWIMNAYTLAMCSTLIAMGALADRLGRKKVFMINIFAFGITSLICGLATNTQLLIVARFFQGISAAGMLACQVAILSWQFRNGPERGAAFAKWGVVFGLGLGFGPIIGGVIVDIFSWEWVFLIHVFIAILTFIFAKSGVVESSDPHVDSIDFAGIITLALSVFGLVYLITQGQDLGLNYTSSILVVSVINFLLFTLIENKVSQPIFDFKVFRIRNFSGALLGACGMNFSFWPFIIYLPIYLQNVLGYNSVMAGLIVLAYTLPTIVIPPYAERLFLKRGPKFVIPIGLFFISIGFILLHFVVKTEYASGITLLPGCLLAGVGLGLTNTPVTNTTTSSLPPERAGMASGMEFSTRMISLAVNIAIMGFILVKGVSYYLTNTLSQDMLKNGVSSLADTIAAGNLAATDASGISIITACDALIHGFGWVTFYGAIAPFVLGVIALFVFNSKK
ncbi:MFS transporter [Xenorhabdus bovienii]|uniref:MFS transporter n=1 Tax=Xenorhabdus bovienii TaxID=40576 RepID=UPI0023B2E903|nr:MFS transporter [Xenorhabdus bovienii]MDE9542371.1 MFS transporter [Xenorhabdus bovienii]